MKFPSKNTLWKAITTLHSALLYSKWLSFKMRGRQTEFWLNKPHFFSIAMPWATSRHPLLQCVVTLYRLCCNKSKVTTTVKLICIHLKMHISTWTFFFNYFTTWVFMFCVQSRPELCQCVILLSMLTEKQKSIQRFWSLHRIRKITSLK